jgi:ribosome-associated translation inhibitor RaiA
MIEKLEIIGEAVDDWTYKYAEKRLKRLDKYMVKKGRKDASVKLTVVQVSKPYGNKYEMVIEVKAPGDKVLIAKEQVANMIAGVDILEAKIVGQMRKVKTVVERKKKGLSHKISKIFRRR